MTLDAQGKTTGWKNMTRAQCRRLATTPTEPQHIFEIFYLNRNHKKGNIRQLELHSKKNQVQIPIFSISLSPLPPPMLVEGKPVIVLHV